MSPTTITPTEAANAATTLTPAILTEGLNTSITAHSTESESGMVSCRSDFVNGTNDTIFIISVREMTAWSVAAASTILFIGSLIINVILLRISICKKRQSKVKEPADTVDVINVEPHIYDIADPPCSNDLRKINVKGAPVYENMKLKRYK